MNTNRYEHHLAIETNELCPFIFKTKTDSLDSPINWHENIEVLLMVEGQGTLQYERKEYAVEPGEIYVINSGAVHHITSGTGLSYQYLIIDQKFCEANGIAIGGYRFQERVRDPETVGILAQISDAYRQVTENQSPLAAANMRRWVLTLLIDLCTKHTCPESHPAERKNAARENVKKMISYINNNYDRQITLEEMAAHVGFNKFYLTREFKKYTGQTPFTYLNILRCKKARLCILNGMTVTEAAYESGFDTLSYFSRTYHKLMGHSPSEIKMQENLA